MIFYIMHIANIAPVSRSTKRERQLQWSSFDAIQGEYTPILCALQRSNDLAFDASGVHELDGQTGITRPFLSTWYLRGARLCISDSWICLWQSRHTNSRFDQLSVTSGFIIFSGVRCLMWCTITPGVYLPDRKQRSHRLPTLEAYALRVFFHADEA